MLQKLGNKNFTLMSKMMGLHSNRHKVIAQNIANVNTPNYRRREFKFESTLKQAMERGDQADIRAVRGSVERPNTTAIRNNGNNVDIDREMVALDENAMFFEIYSNFYRQRSQAVKSAIKGGAR